MEYKTTMVLQNQEGLNFIEIPFVACEINCRQDLEKIYNMVDVMANVRMNAHPGVIISAHQITAWRRGVMGNWCEIKRD